MIRSTFSRLYIFATVALLVALSGCIEITERIRFNEDQSGSFEIEYDMSKLKQTMEMFAAMDTTGEASSEMENPMEDANMDEKTNRLESVQGVSNVKYDMDTSTFIFAVSFDFEDIDALNRGLRELNREYDDDGNPIEEEGDDHEHWIVEGNSLVREAAFGNELGESDEEMSEEEAAQQRQMMQSMFADAYYTTVITFPDAVKDIDSEYAATAQGGREVTVKVPMADLMENPQAISARFDF